MKTIHILMVEDNEGDIILTKEALQESKVNNTVTAVRNGKAAIDYVFKKGEFSKSESPDLILLDINLPLKNGHEVLRAIKENESTRKIPVIMLTTSSSKKDIDQSYRQHANCYIVKPVEVNDFLHSVAIIENFWLNVVKLPGK